MKYAETITDLIGNTPLLRLNRFEAENGLDAVLLAKLEYLNPAGSVKDRVALAMLDDAEAKGLLKPGAVTEQVETDESERSASHHGHRVGHG